MPKSKKRPAAAAKLKARRRDASGPRFLSAPAVEETAPTARRHPAKIHMGWWPHWVIGGPITFCGPNPMARDVPLTADWAEVTCKSCLLLKDRARDKEQRQDGLERARIFLAADPDDQAWATRESLRRSGL